MSIIVTRPIISVDYMSLVRVLMQVKSATPATIIALTDVKMNKTAPTLADKKNLNPFFERVQKKQKSNVFINFDYAASVNRKLLKEGKDADFVAKPRKWGEKLPGTPLVFHDNQYYLECRFLSNEPKIEYHVDGIVTEKSVFESFMIVKSAASAEKQKEHQGVDEVIILRDFLVRNVHEITVNGSHYVRNDI